MSYSIGNHAVRYARAVQRLPSFQLLNGSNAVHVEASFPNSKVQQQPTFIVKSDYCLNKSAANGIFVEKEPQSLSELFSCLTTNETVIRLPELYPSPHLVPPPAPFSSPIHLPQTVDNLSKTVGQLDELLPLYAPEHESQTGVTKHCIRDIVIRRKKMKKAKRKKEMKRNKVSHEQRILRDIMRREENFQSEQGSLLREAEMFNAEQYVADKLAKYNYRPIPKFFRGKRLPEAEMIKEFRKRGLKLPGED